MKRLLSVFGVLLVVGGSAWAQGTTMGAQSQGEQQSGSVQVGAGSKGDVTPGASGPQDDLGEGLEPHAVTFEIRPAVDPFHGPGMLPVTPPSGLRCEVIEDASARSACEGKAARLNGG